MNHGKEENKATGETARDAGSVQIYPNLFGCKDLEALSGDLKDPALEGVDDEGCSPGTGYAPVLHVVTVVTVVVKKYTTVDEEKELS